MPTRARHAMFYLVLAAPLFLVAEAGSYGVERLFLVKSGVFYLPPASSGYDHYLAIRDPELGWPSPAAFGGDRYDAKGARMSPAFPDPTAAPCVSVYGDSFAWSEEVDAAHAWPNLLAQTLHCRVDNFGVGGYGTDQAYLRYGQNRASGREAAPVVVITYYPENLLRNVNQYRDLLYPDQVLGLKPRFLLDGDELTQVPLPNFTHAQFDQALQDPARYFPHEEFVPGNKGAPLWLSFPFTWSLMRSLGNDHIAAKLAGVPFYYRYYQPGDNSHAAALTTAILQHFAADVRAGGATPILLVIPSGDDVRYFKRQQAWVYAPLLHALAGRGVAVENFGEEIVARFPDQDGCALYKRCGGHFTEQGYAALAAYAAKLVGAAERARRPQ